MPQMGESVTEGTILEWHVAEGQEIAEGDTVVEVSTDKIDAEVPAPASGVITKILAQVDDTVIVGQVLAEIDPNGPAGTARRPRPSERRPGPGDRGHRRGRRRTSATATRPSCSSSSRVRVAEADPAAPGREAEEAGERGGRRDAGDGRVGHRGHGARVARRRGRLGRRGRHGDRGLDRQDRRRGARAGGRRRSRSFWSSPTTSSRSASRWRRWRPAPRAAAPAPATSASDRARPRRPRPHRRRLDGEGRASPVARRIAAERGVDLGSVEGSGPGGKVVKADVLAADGNGAAPRRGAARRRGEAPARPRGDARQGDGREPHDPDRDLVPHAPGRHARRQAQGDQRASSRSAGSRSRSRT